MRTIDDLFDALLGELEGLDTGGAREIVREIRARLLTPAAVDKLDAKVCAAMCNGYVPPVKFRSDEIGRAMARAVAANLCVVRTEEKAGEETPWYASLHGGQWRYINTHHRDAISDEILLGPFGSMDESIAAAKKSDENRGAVRPEAETGQFDPRPIIAEAWQAKDGQCLAADREFLDLRPEWRQMPADPNRGLAIIKAALSVFRLDANDPRPIVSDASQATEEQRRKAFRSFCPPVELDIPEDIDEADLGYSFIRAALSAVRLDASPKPVLTEAEIKAFGGTFEKAGKLLDRWRLDGMDVEAYSAELRTCRAALARLKAGSAKLPHEMHPPFEGDPNQESFAKKPHSPSCNTQYAPGPGDSSGDMACDCGASEAEGTKTEEAKTDISTSEADESLSVIINALRQARLAMIDANKGRDGITYPAIDAADAAVSELRSRLVLPQPRRLKDEEAAKLAGMAYFQELKSSTTDTEDGHAIAAEVAKLWGLPAPEHETPKVRRLADWEARDFVGAAANIVKKPDAESGHLLIRIAIGLLGLEYPK